VSCQSRPEENVATASIDLAGISKSVAGAKKLCAVSGILFTLQNRRGIFDGLLIGHVVSYLGIIFYPFKLIALVNHIAGAVGKHPMAHAIDDNMGNLFPARLRFAASFKVDGTGYAMDFRIAVADRGSLQGLGMVVGLMRLGMLR